MSNWIIPLLLLIIGFIVLALFRKKAGKGPVDLPYQSKDVLCSPAERSFLGTLDKIIGIKTIGFSQKSGWPTI